MTLSDFRLSGRQRRAVRALIRVACPSFIARDPARTEQTLHNLELGLRSLPAHVRWLVRLGLLAFDESARAKPSARGRPFRALPPDQALAHFEVFWHSHFAPLSLFAKNLMSLVALACYEIPDAKDRLEYHPDAWITEVARRRLETWGAEIRAHEEDILRPDPLIRVDRAEGAKARDPARQGRDASVVDRLTRKVNHAHPAT